MLLGEDYSPTSVTECTSTLIEIKYNKESENSYIKINYNDNSSVKKEYKDNKEIKKDIETEMNNDHEFKIKSIEVFLKLERLRNIKIVDCPGLGSKSDISRNKEKQIVEEIEYSDIIFFITDFTNELKMSNVNIHFNYKF
jgi:hypothetical protein